MKRIIFYFLIVLANVAANANNAVEVAINSDTDMEAVIKGLSSDVREIIITGDVTLDNLKPIYVRYTDEEESLDKLDLSAASFKDNILPANSFFHGGNLEFDRIGDFVYPTPRLNIKEIVIPESIVEIGKRAFTNVGMETFSLPASLRTIGDQAFYDCSLWSSENIEIPKAMTEIPEGCFFGCLEIKNFTFHPNIEIVKDKAFVNTGCKNFILNEGIRELGDRAFFYGRYSEISLPSTIERIGEECFSYSKVKKIVWPEKVTRLPFAVLSDCKQLTEVILPEGIVQIDEHAFNGSKNLSDISLPNTLKSIGPDAFRKTAIEEIRLPLSLEYLGVECFGETPLKRIYSPSPIPPRCDERDSDYPGKKEYTFASLDTDTRNQIYVYVSKGAKEIYQTTSDWNSLPNYEETDEFPHLKLFTINRFSINHISDPHYLKVLENVLFTTDIYCEVREDAKAVLYEDDVKLTEAVLYYNDRINCNNYQADFENIRLDKTKTYTVELPMGSLVSYNDAGLVNARKVITISEGSAVDEINISPESTNDAIYRIDGVKVSDMSTPGIYIVKGQKKIVLR